MSFLLVVGAGRLAAQTAPEWRRTGLEYLSAGKLTLATPALQKACALETPPGDSCYYLARNYYALTEYEAARKEFERLLAASPSGPAYRAAALNYSALGLDDDAERNFRKAIEIGAGETRVDLGAFLFRQGRTIEAEKMLEAAVRANPESARAHLESGRVLLQEGKLEAAVKRLEESIRRNPADWNAHLLLGRAYQRLGRDADAARELQLGESQWRQQAPRSR